MENISPWLNGFLSSHTQKNPKNMHSSCSVVLPGIMNLLPVSSVQSCWLRTSRDHQDWFVASSSHQTHKTHAENIWEFSCRC